MTSREVIITNTAFLYGSPSSVTRMLLLMYPQFPFPAAMGGASHPGHTPSSLQVCVCFWSYVHPRLWIQEIRLYSYTGKPVRMQLSVSASLYFMCTSGSAYSWSILSLQWLPQPWPWQAHTWIDSPPLRSLATPWKGVLNPQSLCDKTLQLQSFSLFLLFSFSFFLSFFFPFVPLTFDSISGWSLGVIAN